MRTWPDPISINGLAELTGRDRRTITDRLENLDPLEENPQEKLYSLRDALPRIFDFHPDDPGGEIAYDDKSFQPSIEKAKLDKVKREKMELELAEKRRDLIPKEEIKSGLEQVFARVRAKLLGIPGRAAQMIQGPPAKQTEATLKKMIDDALTDLSEGNFE